jgi:tRNA modification GTPase
VRFGDAVASKTPALPILVADIREALNALDEIVGKTYTEDILGRIFSKFCIGK